LKNRNQYIHVDLLTKRPSSNMNHQL